MSYPEIRAQLLRIRKADRSSALKDAAEIWIANIDHITKQGEDADAKRAFMRAYRNFYRIAQNEPWPEFMSPSDLVKTFGLVVRHL